MKNFVIKLGLVLVILAMLLLSGLIPVWPKPVKMGIIKINTYEKIQVMMGTLYID